ncbi:hypothetical protein Agub_g10359, partial [Astrephomene gubernaculifera]
MSSQCPLAYPDKFHAAAKFWSLKPKGSKPLAQENELLLYALKQQATVGPNTTPRPWGWGNGVESTKWQGWKELGNMTSIEAMRLFVKALDEEQPDWWALLQQAEGGAQGSPDPAAAAGDAAAAAADGASQPDPQQPPQPPQQPQGEVRAVVDQAEEGVWRQVETVGAGAEGGAARKPLPRYESAAAVVGECVYVLGGNYGGRYLSDVWSLHLPSATWEHLTLHRGTTAAAGGEQAEQQAGGGAEGGSGGGFPALAGHSVTAWNGKLYVLGGHSKSKLPGPMPLRLVDPAARTWSEPPTAGSPPAARGGHAAVLLGSQLWVLCGEDGGRRALGDVWVLDLESLTWSCPEITGPAPPGRSACCAALYQERYILMFGGGSVSSCFSDLHLLDTVTLRWGQPGQSGAKISPRAGHAGALLGATWFIVGGGNNVRGCTDLLAADLGGLGGGEGEGEGGKTAAGAAAAGHVRWRVVASVALRDPLSSEGISLVALPPSASSPASPRTLLAFGGYNGRYLNTLSVFRAPELSAGSSGVQGEGEGKAAAAPPTAATAAEEQAPAAAAPPQQQQQQVSPTQPLAAPAAAAAGEPPAPASPSARLVAELRQQVAELRAALEGARREAEGAIRESAAAAEGAATELGLLRKQLAGAQGALAEANKALDESRAALGSEQARVLKLEAQCAEMQAKLASLGELERELERHRRAAREAAEREAAAG